MDFIDNLFVDNNIKDFHTVLYSLKKGIAVFNIYIIIVETQTNKFAQIMSSEQFFKNPDRYKLHKVIGIASGKNGANRLLSEIIEYWISRGGDLVDFKDNIIRE